MDRLKRPFTCLILSWIIIMPILTVGGCSGHADKSPTSMGASPGMSQPGQGATNAEAAKTDEQAPPPKAAQGKPAADGSMQPQ